MRVDDPFFLRLYLVLAAIDISTAIWVYTRAPAQLANRVFAAMGLTLTAWTVTIALAHNPPTSSLLVVRITFTAASVLLLAVLTLVYVFPSSPFPRTLPYRVVAVTGIAISLLASSPLIARGMTMSEAGLTVVYGPLHRVFGLYATSVLVLSAFVAGNKVRKAQGSQRLRIWYLIMGLVVPGLAISITNLYIPLVYHESQYGRYGPAFTVIFLVMTAHGIIRHRVMRLRLVIGHGVSRAIAVGVGAALFVAIVMLAVAPATRHLGLPMPVVVALAFVLALLFQPLTSGIQVSLDRYFYRVPYDYDRTVRGVSRVIASTLDLSSLVTHLCDVFETTVQPETVAIYLKRPGADDYALTIVRGSTDTDDAGPPDRLAVRSPLPAYLAAHRTLVLADELSASDGHDVRDALEALSRLGGRCVHPILEDHALMGFVVLGAKLSGDPYYAEDLDLVGTLVSQASIAIKNAQLHRQVLAAENEKRRADRLAAIGALASGIAHEIKNPLVAIKTFAELLPERFTDEEFRVEFSRVMIREIERIDRLVRRLRGLASPHDQELAILDVREPIEEMATLLATRLEQAGVTLERTYDAVPCPILGDAGQLKQLFLNLFVNALDAMPDGGRLRVRLSRRWLLGRDIVMVEVGDTGTGIPADTLPRIFEPFVTTKVNGSGLGLSICRGIADAHRATIRAKNNGDGGGVTIELEFPLAADAAFARTPSSR